MEALDPLCNKPGRLADMPKFSALASKVLLSSDGTEIFAECIGDHAKPHIVFVHGFTLSGSVFDKIFLDTKYQEDCFLASQTFCILRLV